jgi:hypothetical protein
MLSEIEDKIRNQVPPTEKDKEILQYRLNKQLTEEDHIYIFTEILQPMEKKIYTITENHTLFDLNDIDPKTFWKIYYSSQMAIDNQNRGKVYKSMQQENDKNMLEFTQKVTSELQKQGPIHESIANVSEYERLRIEALKQCTYSNYAQTDLTKGFGPDESEPETESVADTDDDNGSNM